MKDQEIVRLFLDRNEDASGETRKQYAEYGLYIADNVLHDRQDSEECLNDALLAAWNSIPPQSPENLRTYLGKLVREIAINRWKQKNRQKRNPGSTVQSLDEIAEMVSAGDLEEEISANELAREISAYLYSIDETKRNVFIRRYWYYDSIEQICTLYGFGKSKVLVMLKRTRDGLAAHLKKKGFII